MINGRNSEIDEGFDDNNSDQKSECDGSKPPWVQFFLTKKSHFQM
jgi:hypothetical protein